MACQKLYKQGRDDIIVKVIQSLMPASFSQLLTLVCNSIPCSTAEPEPEPLNELGTATREVKNCWFVPRVEGNFQS